MLSKERAGPRAAHGSSSRVDRGPAPAYNVSPKILHNCAIRQGIEDWEPDEDLQPDYEADKVGEVGCMSDLDDLFDTFMFRLDINHDTMGYYFEKPTESASWGGKVRDVIERLTKIKKIEPGFSQIIVELRQCMKDLGDVILSRYDYPAFDTCYRNIYTIVCEIFGEHRIHQRPPADQRGLLSAEILLSMEEAERTVAMMAKHTFCAFEMGYLPADYYHYVAPNVDEDFAKIVFDSAFYVHKNFSKLVKFFAHLRQRYHPHCIDCGIPPLLMVRRTCDQSDVDKLKEFMITVMKFLRADEGRDDFEAGPYNISMSANERNFLFNWLHGKIVVSVRGRSSYYLRVFRAHEGELDGKLEIFQVMPRDTKKVYRCWHPNKNGEQCLECDWNGTCWSVGCVQMRTWRQGADESRNVDTIQVFRLPGDTDASWEQIKRDAKALEETRDGWRFDPSPVVLTPVTFLEVSFPATPLLSRSEVPKAPKVGGEDSGEDSGGEGGVGEARESGEGGVGEARESGEGGMGGGGSGQGGMGGGGSGQGGSGGVARSAGKGMGTMQNGNACERWVNGKCVSREVYKDGRMVPASVPVAGRSMVAEARKAKEAREAREAGQGKDRAAGKAAAGGGAGGAGGAGAAAGGGAVGSGGAGAAAGGGAGGAGGAGAAAGGGAGGAGAAAKGGGSHYNVMVPPGAKESLRRNRERKAMSKRSREEGEDKEWVRFALPMPFPPASTEARALQEQGGVLFDTVLSWLPLRRSRTGEPTDKDGVTAAGAHAVLYLPDDDHKKNEEKCGVLRVGTHVSVLIDADTVRGEHKEGLYPGVIAAVSRKHKAFLARLVGPDLQRYSYAQWYFARHLGQEWTFGLDLCNVPKKARTTHKIYEALEGN